MIVTIDGPAGAGKSTAARELAARLGFQFLDTGAMYRAVTWACLDRKIELTDERAVAETARRLDLRLEAERVFVDGTEVTQAIRMSEVTDETRHIAGNQEVRAHLVDLQRRLAAGKDVVAEGRDQGTVAFPHAECKFFLTADPLQRALRRQRELALRGEDVSVDALLAQQTSRDERDEGRTVGALKPAADALIVDTSDRPLCDVLDHLEEVVRRGMAERWNDAPN